MKRNLLLATIITLTLLNLNAQSTFQKTFGGPDQEFGKSIQLTTDSSYIIVGGSKSFGAGDWDVYLIKTDTNGDTLWTKTYGGADLEYGHLIQQTTDTGFIIVGETKSFGAGNRDIYLIKTDTNGDTLWTKTYGGQGNDKGYSIQQTNDTGYIITGQMEFPLTPLNKDVFLIKTNADGDTLWTKIYGGEILDESGFSVQQTFDDGYIITGYASNLATGHHDVYLIKTNADGDTLWTKTFEGTGNDWGRYVEQTTDTGFIIIGETRSFGAGETDIYLIKTDVNGDILWTKTYGGTGLEYGFSGQQTADDGYIIIGTTWSFGAGQSDAYVIKTRADGDTIWTKTYGGTDQDSGSSIRQTSDGYIFSCHTYSFGVGESDTYLIKTDNEGNSNCNEYSTNTIISSPNTVVSIFPTIVGEGMGATLSNPSTIMSNTTTTVSILCPIGSIQENNELNVQIYPNPFSTFVNLEFDNSKGEEHTLTIFNYSGQMVRKINNITDGEIIIDRGNLINGLYLFQLRTDNKIIGTMKLILE